MKLASLMSRLMLVSGLVAVLAAPVLAGRGGSTGLEEPGTLANVHAKPATASCESQPCCAGDNAARPATLAPSAQVKAAASKSQAPGTPAQPADKRAHGKAATSPAIKAQRPSTARNRSSSRQTPATPSMGSLLRVGTGAGQEISLYLEDAHSTARTSISGRAPPRAGPPSTFAPAALPVAPPDRAIEIHAGLIPPGPASTRPSPERMPHPSATSSMPFVRDAAARNVPRTLAGLGRASRPRARRPGSTAPRVFMLSGGFPS
jgi:hypothetical protein